MKRTRQDQPPFTWRSNSFLRPVHVLKSRVLFSIIPVFSLLVLALSCKGQSNIYSLSVYAGGVSHSELCSLAFPFWPHEYKLSIERWTEDANGLTVSFVGHKNSTSDISRRALDVTFGTNSFSLALDFNPSKKLKNTYGSVGLKETSDLAKAASQCITQHGGHMSASLLPVIPRNWIRLSRESVELFALDGDHFEEIQRLLERAFGTPDGSIRSSVPIGNGHSLTYTPEQVGVAVNLSGNSSITILSVIGKRTR